LLLVVAVAELTAVAVAVLVALETQLITLL
jgi:hypothetical protein